jgi:hypothetical protein
MSFVSCIGGSTNKKAPDRVGDQGRIFRFSEESELQMRPWITNAKGVPVNHQ